MKSSRSTVRSLLDFLLFCFISFGVVTAGDRVVETKETQREKSHESFFGENVNAGENYCKDLDDCKFRRKPKCWGYEDGCSTPDKWYKRPVCDDQTGWRHYASNEDKVVNFWKEADFGYVKKFIDSTKEVCRPLPGQINSGSLRCSEGLEYCKAENLYLDLRKNVRSQQNRYQPDLLGGFCDLDVEALHGLGGHRMELTSWISEVENYKSLPFNPVSEGHCDVIVERPTFFMKLDAVVNMYHHFCDFFNLYVTQHVNGSFTSDVNVVLWESYARRGLGNFGQTWRVFSEHPILYLGHEYAGKQVCFKQAIFSLLPRMVFGLFYNTPLTPGCSGSGLFKAFSDHLMDRLGIRQERKDEDVDEPIRVTLLSRGTQFRAILNEQEIIDALLSHPDITLRIAKFSWDIPFLEQLKLTHNSDVFIGMHGAGLTHALFLPDWALLFELYNCGDPNCYKDLAHLRGVNYITWEDEDKVIENTKELHPEYSDHPKFRNYAFDVKEFMRLVTQAVTQVRVNLKSRNQTQAEPRT